MTYHFRIDGKTFRRRFKARINAADNVHEAVEEIVGELLGNSGATPVATHLLLQEIIDEGTPGFWLNKVLTIAGMDASETEIVFARMAVDSDVQVVE